MKVEYITDWETIYSDDFQKQWLEWVEKAENSHVFFHPALCMAWLETYRPLRNLEPLFCIGRSENQIIFLPLVLWKRNWKNAFQKLLVPVGYSDFDYHDPLIINGSDSINTTVNAFISQIITTCHLDAFCLDGIREGIEIADFNETNTEPCPFIELQNFNSIDDYLSSLSKNTRKSFKRRVNKLEEDYDKIEFFQLKDVNSKEFKNEFDNLMNHHCKRWPNAYKAPNFHINLLSKGLEQNVVFFTIVKAGNTTIAWQIGFVFKKVYYLYMPAIHHDYLNYSPGKISLVYNIENALKLNCAIVDQLRGDELYKSEWTEKFVNIKNLEYIPNRVSAVLKKKLIALK